MGRPPRRGQPLNKGQDGGSERVRYSEVSLYIKDLILLGFTLPEYIAGMKIKLLYSTNFTTVVMQGCIERGWG